MSGMLTVLPAVQRLSPRIIRVLGCNPGLMTLQGTNTYIIGTGPESVPCQGQASNSNNVIKSMRYFVKTVIESDLLYCFSRVLVDAGERDNSAYISSLVGVLKQYEVQLAHIIITHWHHDHIGGLCDVLTATNSML